MFFCKNKAKKEKNIFLMKMQLLPGENKLLLPSETNGPYFKLFQCKNKQKKEKIIIKTYKNCNFFIIILQIAGNTRKNDEQL